jgi:AcrR family transcriptional regulator
VAAERAGRDGIDVGGDEVAGRRRAPERTREQLIVAAEAAFTELGYSATSIQRICRAAGVSVGSFYNHFDHKPGVTFQVLERSSERLVQTLGSVDVSRPATIETAVGLLATGSAAALYRALREAADVEPTVREVFAAHRRVAHDQLAAAVTASRAQPDGRYALDARSVAWTLLALLWDAIAAVGDPGRPAAQVIARAVSYAASAGAALDQ